MRRHFPKRQNTCVVDLNLIRDGRNLVETVKDGWIEDGLIVFLIEIPTERVLRLSVIIAVVKCHVQIVGQCSCELISLVNELVGVVRGIRLSTTESLALGNNSSSEVGDDAKIVTTTTKGKVQVRVCLFIHIDDGRVR